MRSTRSKFSREVTDSHRAARIASDSRGDLKVEAEAWWMLGMLESAPGRYVFDAVTGTLVDTMKSGTDRKRCAHRFIAMVVTNGEAAIRCTTCKAVVGELVESTAGDRELDQLRDLRALVLRIAVLNPREINRGRWNEVVQAARASMTGATFDPSKCRLCHGRHRDLDTDGHCQLCEIVQLDWERAHLTCSCGNSYEWATFIELERPIAGSQQPSEDESGKPITLELRNCTCRSTMARVHPGLVPCRCDLIAGPRPSSPPTVVHRATCDQKAGR